MQQEVEDYIKNKMVTEQDAFGLVKFTLVQLGGLSVVYERVEQKGAAFRNGVSVYQNGQRKATVYQSELKQFWQMTVGMTMAPSGYRAIKDNEEWRAIYGVKAGLIYYVDSTGKPYPKSVFETVACKSKECGIVMPLKSATIDHRHPQSGGKDDAARRVFRAIGLTKQEPFNDAGFTLYLRSCFYKKLTGDSRSDLSYAGIVIFTCLHLSGYYDEFCQKCLNHFVNLQPMCFTCNSKKGSWGY